MINLKDVVDIGLLEAIANCRQVGIKGIARLDTGVPDAISTALELHERCACRVDADELFGRSNLQEPVAVPGQLAQGQHADQTSRPSSIANREWSASHSQECCKAAQ